MIRERDFLTIVQYRSYILAYVKGYLLSLIASPPVPLSTPGGEGVCGTVKFFLSFDCIYGRCKDF